MTVLQFNSFPQMRQMQLIWDRGRFLSHRYTPSCKVALFDMETFYAEIYYDREQGGVKKIKGMSDVSEISYRE